MDQHAGHGGREPAGKSERVVGVTPDHDEPDVRVGIRRVDGLGPREGGGRAMEYSDRQNSDQRSRGTEPESSHWSLLRDGDATNSDARRAEASDLYGVLP